MRLEPLTFSILPQRLAVCRLAPDEALPAHLSEYPFWSLTRTSQELSVVLPEEGVLDGWQAEKGWRGLQVRGPLDFGLVGVLASISTALAQAGISLFALSTYDTDYILVRDVDLERAVGALLGQGHTVLEG